MGFVAPMLVAATATPKAIGAQIESAASPEADARMVALSDRFESDAGGTSGIGTLRLELAKLWSEVCAADVRARALPEVLEHIPRFEKVVASLGALRLVYVADGLIALLHGMRLDAVRNVATRHRPKTKPDS
jgi:hypothetical protein